MDIFVEAQGRVDLAEILRARGDSIEPGLSVVDTDLPIAGRGQVDAIAIDTDRRLVIVDVSTPGEEIGTRLANHARWFVDNLPIVKRMYQLWNVNWDRPLRAVGIRMAGTNGSALASLDGASLEVMTVRLIRTREGREALYITSGAPKRMTVNDFVPETTSPSEAVRDEPHEPIDWRETERSPREARAPLPGEAYRRELGLSQEEIAEFLAGSVAPERPAHKGRLKSGRHD